MTDTANDALRNTLEGEMDDMPMMALDLTGALLLVGDALDIDPLHIVQGIMRHDLESDDPMLNDLREAHGTTGVNLMIDLIFEAVDSSTYLPFILRSLEISETLNALD
jgi:hypothetical protein